MSLTEHVYSTVRQRTRPQPAVAAMGRGCSDLAQQAEPQKNGPATEHNNLRAMTVIAYRRYSSAAERLKTPSPKL